MINCTTNFPTSMPVSWVKKWGVTYLNDNDGPTPPALIVGVSLYDHSGADIAWPYNPYMLYLYDAVPSQVLTVNPSPTDLRNQFLLSQVQLSGTAYTTLTAAMYAATGKGNMRKAVENLLVTAGAMPSQLAGT